jgi:hypothetical protein
MPFRNPVRLLWGFGWVTEFTFRAYLVLLGLAFLFWWERVQCEADAISLLHKQVDKWRAREMACREREDKHSAEFWQMMASAFEAIVCSQEQEL